MKKLLDNPYLAPVMTPLKWVSQCAAVMLSPYTDTYKTAKNNKKHPNPFLNYFLNMFDEKANTQAGVGGGCILVAGPAGLAAVLGLMCSFELAGSVVAGAILPLKIIGGMATVATATAAAAVAAPLLVAAAVAIAAVTIPTAIVTVPGIFYGCKQAFDHVTGRAAAAVPTVPSAAAPLDEQITAQLKDMPDDQKKDMLDLMKNGIGCTFAANAATTLDNKIAVNKTIRLKQPRP